MSLIFTNGCFDILHVGHIELLKYAKSLGDYLIVGINSDISVRKLKGSTRPINNELNRKSIIDSIKYVDKSIIFNEETPLDLIKELKPDIIVKGGDYTKEQVVGYGFAKVIIFELIKNVSTTSIIKSINNR
jgi:D-beta-D-heptose 7-phosphate kinase/D-beta-D-heptose 1-phosphate adenosyltransferase